MRIFFLVSTLGLFVFSGIGLFAQKVLSVDEAVKLGLANNLSLQQSSIDFNAKKRASDNRWFSIVPLLNASVSTTGTEADLVSPQYTPTSSSSGTAALSASITINTALFTDMEKTRLAYDSGVVSYESAKKTLELAIRKAYYNLLVSKKSIELDEQNIARSQTNYNETVIKYKAGLIPEIDMLSAQVTLEKLKPTADSAHISYVNSLGAFKIYLGLPLESDIDLSGNLTIADDKVAALDETTKSGSKNLDLRALDTSLKLAGVAKSAASLNLIVPTLTISTSGSQTLANSSTTGTQSRTNTGTVTGTLSLSLSELLPWSGKQELIHTANEAVDKLNLQIAETQKNTRLAIDNLIRKVELSKRNIKVLELNAALTEKTYNLFLDAYKHGTKDLISVQSAQGDMESAKNSELSERYNLISNLLDLENTLGLPFGTLWK